MHFTNTETLCKRVGLNSLNKQYLFRMARRKISFGDDILLRLIFRCRYLNCYCSGWIINFVIYLEYTDILLFRSVISCCHFSASREYHCRLIYLNFDRSELLHFHRFNRPYGRLCFGLEFGRGDWIAHSQKKPPNQSCCGFISVECQ